MRSTRLIPFVVSAVVLAGSVLLSAPPGVGAPANGPVITTRVVHGGQVTRLVNSSGPETAPAVGPEAGQSQGPVANRSLSSKARATRNPNTLSGIPAPSTAVVGATGARSFSGIDHHEQRLEVAGGNQWSLEPPDQGLCVGNGYVFEAVNNAVAVYNSSGTRLIHDSLNHFFRYPVEIDRTTGRGRPEADHRSDVPLRPGDRAVLRDDPDLRLGRGRQPAPGRHQHPRHGGQLDEQPARGVDHHAHRRDRRRHRRHAAAHRLPVHR